MGFFKEHKFRASPLSLAVPLEGSETVPGLRELQKRTDTYKLVKALNVDALDGSKQSRVWRKRYRGPYVSDLSLQDFQKNPKTWRCTLYGQAVHSYNLPEGLDHLFERAEENTMTYLPNLLRILLYFVALRMLLRPWSLLGALTLAIPVLIRLTLRSPPQQRAAPLGSRFWNWLQGLTAEARAAIYQTEVPAAERSPPAISDPNLDMLQSVSQIACYFMLVYCNTLGVVLRAFVWWSVAAWAFVSLRRSSSELAEALRAPGLSGRPQAAVSTHPCVPGIAFSDVIGWTQGGSEDPRRVFREAWEFGFAVTSAAAVYVWHAAQFQTQKLHSWLNSSVVMRIRRPVYQ